MDRAMVEQIKNHPSYRKLVDTRKSFAWTLTIIMLVVYYAFILFIAFSPETLGTKLDPNGMATWGIPIGVGIIIFAFAMTGVYVKKANSEFDELSEQVKREIGEMK